MANNGKNNKKQCAEQWDGANVLRQMRPQRRLLKRRMSLAHPGRMALSVFPREAPGAKTAD